MNRVLNICLTQVRLQFSQRSNLVFMFLMPLLFTLLFGKLFAGGGGSSGIPVAIVDADQSVVSQRLTHELQQDPALHISTAAERDLEELVHNHKIEAALLIPKGYGDALLQGQNPALDLRTVTGSDTVQVSLLVRQHNLQIAQAAQVAGLMSPGAGASAAFTKAMDAYAALPTGYTATSQARTANQQLGSASFAALGFSIMFLMMSLVSMAGVFLEERVRGTWQRILFSPVSRVQIMGGYLLSFLLAGWLQFGILVGLSHLLFGVNWGSFGPLAAVVTAFIVATSGLGLFLAGIVKSAEQQRGFGSLITNATSMLGGAFWSLDLVGPTMRKVAYLTPQAWAIDGLREVMLRGGQWGHLLVPIAVLLGMGMIFTAVGLTRVRFN